MVSESTKKDFREFEALREGNYVRYENENRLWKVTKISKQDAKTIVNLEHLKEEKYNISINSIRYIPLTPNILLLKDFGFRKVEQKNEFQFNLESGDKYITTFKKKYSSLILVDYTNLLKGVGRYFLYEPKVISDRVNEENAKTTDETLNNRKKDKEITFDSIVKENTYAIFHIHALQNYLQKYPKITSKRKIDFDKIVPQLKLY